MAEFGLSPDPSGIDGDLNDVESTCQKSGGIFEVVETPDGRVVGSTGLLPIGLGVCEARKMYVLADFRGIGLGKLLIDRAIHHARTLGFRRIELETATVLEAAVRLDRKVGFRPATRDHVYDRCDLVMALVL